MRYLVVKCVALLFLSLSLSLSGEHGAWAGAGRHCHLGTTSGVGCLVPRRQWMRSDVLAQFNAGVAMQCTRGLTGKRGCLRLCRPKTHVHQQYHQEIHHKRRQDCRTNRCAAAPAVACTPSNTWVTKVNASCFKGLTSQVCWVTMVSYAGHFVHLRRGRWRWRWRGTTPM